jgi:ferredoxin, 2Fe-2S
MPKVVYIEHDGTEHTVDVALGLSIMEGARSNNVPGIDADCGGACACATCHVHVLADWMAAVGLPSAEEAEMLDFVNNRDESSRLSCQIKMSDALRGLTLQLPESQR